MSRAVEPSWRHHRERALLSVLAIGYFLGGYVLLSSSPTTAGAIPLRTAFDDAVPFLPWTCTVYSLVYTSALFPLFVIRCPRLFRRTALAYVIVLTVAFATFTLFPVTTLGLRPDVSGLDMTVFHNWGMALTYRVDPPYNAFPSLHLAMALLAALCVHKAHRGLGRVALVVAAAIGVSTWTVKQHWVLDSIAALTLTAVVYALVVRPYNPATVRRSERAYSWRGPAAYLLLPLAEYLGMVLVYRAGWLSPS